MLYDTSTVGAVDDNESRFPSDVDKEEWDEEQKVTDTCTCLKTTNSQILS